MKTTQLDNGLTRHQMSFDSHRIADLALRINDAVDDVVQNVSMYEKLAAHAYYLGTLLGISGVVMDFGTPEPGSPIALIQRAYREAAQCGAH
ncbi:hypothetical protein THICB3320741 [Thiomonas sp. CB3]|nr:hypothetical protein THICB3320741 [Thiomonas sp. CB3]